MTVKAEYKIIADHLRSSAFLIADGVMPSNEGRGYVLRRIMRRAMRQAHKLGAKEPLLHHLVDGLIKEMGQQYPELLRAQDSITAILKDEEEKFRETLEKGLKILDDEIALILANKDSKADNKNTLKNTLSGQIAFKLYDTFGFPLDLTQDICQEKNITVAVAEFENEMDMQRQRARKNWAGSGENSEDKIFFLIKEKFGETITTYHKNTQSLAKVLAIVKDNEFITEISNYSSESTNSNIFLILNQTPFYATSGGQKGDDGNIIKSSDIKNNLNSTTLQDLDYHQLDNVIDIFETKKFAGNIFAHYLAQVKGNFKVGDEIIALVNNRNRQLRAQNHSATHLLHKALKQVLGNSISQKGSNVDAKYLTFDFNLNRAMSKAEIDQVEELVNFYIRQNCDVNTNEMPLEQARNSGAEALFGEKYEELVRVVQMGISIELCGGTHVKNTGNIGIFKIISENGVASGVRRITAKSGFFALQHLKIQEQKLYALLDSLKVKQQFDEIKFPENEFLSNKIGFDDLAFFSAEKNGDIISDNARKSVDEITFKTATIGEDFQQQLKNKDKEIAKLKKQIWQENIKNLHSQKINNVNLLHHIFYDIDAKDLREITNEIKCSQQFSSQHIIACFAIDDNKVSLCLAVSNDLQDKFEANKLITLMIEKLDGKGGGGKKDLAMGGGTNPAGIDNALLALKKLL
ncbi:MAG: alanine--tRNA ligase [Alphaproteobacteria bacterium]